MHKKPKPKRKKRKHGVSSPMNSDSQSDSGTVKYIITANTKQYRAYLFKYSTEIAFILLSSVTN